MTRSAQTRTSTVLLSLAGFAVSAAAVGGTLVYAAQNSDPVTPVTEQSAPTMAHTLVLDLPSTASPRSDVPAPVTSAPQTDVVDAPAPTTTTTTPAAAAATSSTTTAAPAAPTTEGCPREDSEACGGDQPPADFVDPGCPEGSVAYLDADGVTPLCGPAADERDEGAQQDEERIGGYRCADPTQVIVSVNPDVCGSPDELQ
jgi:hypothetical protein